MGASKEFGPRQEQPQQTNTQPLNEMISQLDSPRARATFRTELERRLGAQFDVSFDAAIEAMRVEYENRIRDGTLPDDEALPPGFSITNAGEVRVNRLDGDLASFRRQARTSFVANTSTVIMGGLTGADTFNAEPIMLAITGVRDMDRLFVDELASNINTSIGLQIPENVTPALAVRATGTAVPDNPIQFDAAQVPEGHYPLAARSQYDRDSQQYGLVAGWANWIRSYRLNSAD